MNAKTAKRIRKAVGYRGTRTEYEKDQVHHLTEHPTFLRVGGRQVLQSQTNLVPVWKPRRLKAGSTRAVYKLLKRLERTVGLDAVYAELADAR